MEGRAPHGDRLGTAVAAAAPSSKSSPQSGVWLIGPAGLRTPQTPLMLLAGFLLSIHLPPHRPYLSWRGALLLYSGGRRSVSGELSPGVRRGGGREVTLPNTCDVQALLRKDVPCDPDNNRVRQGCSASCDMAARYSSCFSVCK